MRNKRIKSAAIRVGAPVFETSYDRFALENAPMLLELEKGLSLDSGSGQSHIIRGNRTAFSSERLAIKYDTKWMLEPPSFVLFCLRFIFKANKKWVHDHD